VTGWSKWRPRAARGVLLAAAFYTCATFLFTYPIPVLADRAVDNYGDPLFNTWTLAWDWHALTTRPLDLFNANIFYPNPNTLAYSENQVVTALIAGPIDALTGNPILALNFVVLLSFPLTALAAYALILHLTGSQRGALIGGFIFGFAHYRLGQLSHVQLLTSFWLPLTLLWLHRFVERPNLRDAALIGLAIGLQWWTTIYYAFYLVFAAGLFAVWALATRAVKVTRTVALGGVIAASIAAIITAPAIEPYLDIRATVGVRALTDQEGATVADYLRPQPQSLMGRALGLGGKKWEHTLFPGIVALGLAGIGAFRGNASRADATRGRWWLWYYTLLGLLAVVLSFGPTLLLTREAPPLVEGMPYAWLYRAVPPLAALRVPARMVVLLMLAVAVLAGRGIGVGGRDFQRMIETEKRMGRSHLLFRFVSAGCLSIGIAGALVLEYLSFPAPHFDVPTGAAVPPVYRWLATQEFDGAIFELPTARTSNITDDQASIALMARQQYFSTYHMRPIAIGYSGTNAPSFADVIDYAPAAASPPGIAYLRGLGVGRIVVHRDEMTWDEWARFAESAARQPDLLHVADVGGSSVYSVAPAATSRSALRARWARWSKWWSFVLPSPASRYAYLIAQNATDSAVVNLAPGRYAVRVEWLTGDRVIGTQDFAGAMPNVVDPGQSLIPFRLNAPAGATGVSAMAAVGGEPLSVGAAPLPGASWRQVEIPFGSDLLLSYADLPGDEIFTAGDAWLVKLRWTLASSQGGQDAVSLQLVDANEQKVSQADYFFPAVGASSAGQTFIQRSILTLPRDLVPGQYRLRAIAYRQSDIAPIGEETTLATIRVRQPDKFVIQHPVSIRLADAAQLLGFDAEPSAVRSGEPLRVTLYWRRLRAMDEDYTVFVHLVRPDGSFLTQQDNPPRSGSRPTSAWADGETVIDHYTLTIPLDAESGTYSLAIGMYLPKTGVRLAALDANRDRFAGDSATLGTVEVAP
ncbi:MAG: hypothetical protein HY023_17265, partial [Chloroflexi bacterium]|nr:hypothetical protein [Chloroflexota bacterium]